MEIIELDLLDGRGLIPVAVAGHIEAIRTRAFFKESISQEVKLIELADRIDEMAQGITERQAYDIATELRIILGMRDEPDEDAREMKAAERRA